MSYTPTEWATGDIVTAEKLNNMESGISAASLPSVDSADNGKVLTVVEGEWSAANASGGGSGKLTYDAEEYSLNASYNDIVTMLESGVVPWFIAPPSLTQLGGDVVLSVTRYIVNPDETITGYFVIFNGINYDFTDDTSDIIGFPFYNETATGALLYD